MQRILIAVFLIITITHSAIAQNTYDFLRLDPSPRAAALAGSYVANTDDPNVVFYNPAGIVSLEENPISLSYFKHLVDINSASIAYSQNFESIGRFAAGIQYINYGSFTKSNELGERLGEFNASEIAILVGYGGALDENFHYGANVKFIYSGIEEYYSTGMAVDLGMQYLWLEQGWNFGISIQNLGSQIKTYFSAREDLPLNVQIGFSKKLQHMPFEFFFAFNKLNQDEGGFSERFSNITAGGEFRLSNVIRLRLGYDNEKRKELKVGTTAGLAGFNLGLGIITNGYNIDYSFSSLGSIGAMHRFGITTQI
ncbi:MAG: hypothetical protein CVV23_01430 [Ignavibacteriae bacterium HGW-Ignavibacteriae-2]|jgi:hypothetical protein|nr:MAG: hypothetical protein CVV23_01430 [Ignavibacteriae bacterium HGW-Ignavibacteriae-2]